MLALEGMMNTRFVIEQQSPPGRTAFPPHGSRGGRRRAERIRIAEPTRGGPPHFWFVFGISGSGCPARRHQPERPMGSDRHRDERIERADGVAFVFAFLLAFFFAIYGHSDEAAAKNDALSFKRFG